MEDLEALEALIMHNAQGLGGESRVRAFQLLKGIERVLSVNHTLGDVRLELSISVRAIPPPGLEPVSRSTRDASGIWQGQALEVIRSLREGIPA